MAAVTAAAGLLKDKKKFLKITNKNKKERKSMLVKV